MSQNSQETFESLNSSSDILKWWSDVKLWPFEYLTDCDHSKQKPQLVLSLYYSFLIIKPIIMPVFMKLSQIISILWENIHYM